MVHTCIQDPVHVYPAPFPRDDLRPPSISPNASAAAQRQRDMRLGRAMQQWALAHNSEGDVARLDEVLADVSADKTTCMSILE